MRAMTLKHAIFGQALELDTVVSLSIEVADALDTAHAEGIIHRDIKPANIFITRRGHAKILDFGLAKLSVDRRQGCGTARLRHIAGHAGGDSRAPHQSGNCPGHGRVYVTRAGPRQGIGCAHRSLLFGTVLYEMATGRLPFRGDTSAAGFPPEFLKSAISIKSRETRTSILVLC
jgi:serine/threonine protein kinase